MQNQLLINGELVTGEGEKQAVYNPATGEVLLEMAEASAAQVDAAVQAADRAFTEWGQTTPKTRAECLLKLADVIEANADAFAKLESLNCGKPLHCVQGDEIPAVVDVFRFFAGAARCLNGLAAGEYLEGHTSMIRRDPVGVVASIAPWNYPLMMAAWKLAPALAAGNCVVIKPSEITPLTALKLAELAKDIFPPGVLNVLFGRGKTVGDPLTGHEKVRMVSLTGSIATGEHIIGHTASSVKRTHMELGGKAPVIVFDDADLDAVVEGVRTFGFYNAGQDCTAACRIYAQKGIYPALVEKLQLPTDVPQTLVFVRRRVLADDTPVLFSTDILPLALFDNKRLEGIDFSQPIFDIAARHCHTEVTETVAHFHAVSGPAGIRRQLALRPEQALLQLEEICYSRLCKPVLCCQTYYTDFFDFAMVRKLL